MRAMRTILLLALVAAGFVAGFGYGRWYKKPAAVPAPPSGPRILYYVDPMHPQYKSDKPGIAPDCGMKLEPVYADEPPAVKPGSSGGTANMPAGTVHITPDKQQLIGVTFATAELASASRTLRTVGKVGYDETRIARVHTKVDGWVAKVFVDFTGDSVKKGQPLFTIYSPELLATQQEFLLALRAKDVMQHSSMDAMRSSGDSLLAASRRRLELWDLTPAQIDELARTKEPAKNVTVYSPISGYVTDRKVFPNQRVTPEMDLYTIVDLSRVWVMADVYEYEAPNVRMGQPAVISLAYQAGRQFSGRVSYVQPQVDPTTRTVKVRLELANPSMALKPEMFTDVEFLVFSGKRLTVPAGAVLDSGERKTVFLDRGDGYFEPRQVETGERAGERVEILRGLQAGDRVVASGNFLLDSESQLKAALSDMKGQHQH